MSQKIFHCGEFRPARRVVVIAPPTPEEQAKYEYLKVLTFYCPACKKTPMAWTGFLLELNYWGALNAIRTKDQPTWERWCKTLKYGKQGAVMVSEYTLRISKGADRYSLTGKNIGQRSADEAHKGNFSPHEFIKLAFQGFIQGIHTFLHLQPVHGHKNTLTESLDVARHQRTPFGFEQEFQALDHVKDLQAIVFGGLGADFGFKHNGLPPGLQSYINHDTQKVNTP